jgi:hypothetical protein
MKIRTTQPKNNLNKNKNKFPILNKSWNKDKTVLTDYKLALKMKSPKNKPQ